MSRVFRPLRASITWVLLSAATGALAAACSAIVSPDTSRLDPGAEVDGGGVGVDSGTSCPGGCDDGVACTTDTCEATGCAHATDDGACGAGERCNAVMGCVALRCTTDAECDDGSACTGEERCDPDASADPSGCVSGTPAACDDGFSCTNDLCVDAAGGCVFMPSDAACGDGVDCTEDTCAPTADGHDEAGCVHEEDDALCDDGFCFTGGTCDASSGCVGSMPRACPNDGDRCTMESCDPAASMCVSTPIPGCSPGDTGETCATALPISLDATGNGRATGTLSSFADDYAFCGSSGGRDAVYYFEVTRLSDVVIDTAGSAADTVLAIAFDCTDPPGVCNDDRDPGASNSSRIFLHRVGPPPGTASLRVYVFVDGWNAGASGAFQVSVAARAARPDSCSEPMDITGGGTLLGVGPFVSTGIGGPTGRCQGPGDAGDAEAIFRMRPPGDRAHHQVDVYSTTFVPEIYMRTGCAGGTEIDCDIGSAVGGINAARLSTGFVAADSTQYLFVDGMVGSAPTGGPHAYLVVYDP